MKKIWVLLFIFVAFLLSACGLSKTQINEMSSSCDVMLEVRYIQNDSIALYVGNTMFVNTQQVVRSDFFPFLVSKRDPMDIDIPTATTVLHSPEEFIDYLKGSASSLSMVGLVMGENVKNEIGFEESDAIQKFTELLKTVEGSSLILFHEKGGQLVKAKKLF